MSLTIDKFLDRKLHDREVYKIFGEDWIIEPVDFLNGRRKKGNAFYIRWKKNPKYMLVIPPDLTMIQLVRLMSSPPFMIQEDDD